MAIHYVLRENKATADPNDYYAAVITTGNYTFDDLIATMKEMGSTVSEADMRAAAPVLFAALLLKLKDGGRVNTPWFSAVPTIKKKFNGPTDSFDSTRHTLDIAFGCGPGLLNQFQAEAVTQKEVDALPAAILTQFKDFTSNTTNTQAKSGGPGEIKGDNLKIDPTKAEEGVFFVKISDNTSVKATLVTGNFPKTLSFTIPTLVAAAYRLEVRNRQSVDGPLRTGSLPQNLTGLP